MQNPPHIVIVGAGFGGMQAARSLARAQAKILLIDRNNYHTFVPLLYQVATAQLEPEKVAYPIRTLLRRSPNVHFLMAEVEQVDLAARCLKTNRGFIPYDHLVIATGSETQYLGVPGAAEHGFSMRTLRESITLRNHILHCFEQAVHECHPEQLQQLLTFVIVGGGPTGVELAGALVELVRGPLRRDYPTLDIRQVRIVMIQSGDRPLVNLPPQLGNYTTKTLRCLGVKVYLGSRVSKVSPTTVELNDGQIIAAATVIWTAGMEAAVPPMLAELPVTHKGKIAVQPTLQLSDYPEVYVVGDAAFAKANGEPLAGVAPEALQQGVAVARNLRRQLRGQYPKPFQYFNKGRLAIIGCFSGVGKIGPFVFGGFLGWFLWLAVHVIYMPGFRNRLLVLISWFHTYLFRDRAVRQIFPVAKPISASRR